MAAVAEQKLLAMQQQLEAVVAMMDEGKNANRRLAKDLAASKLREKEQIARAEAAEQQAAELTEKLAAAEEATAAADKSRGAAERQLEQEAAAASSRYEAAVAEAADAADAGRRKVQNELDAAKRKHADELRKFEALTKAREATLAAEVAEAESECVSAEERGEKLAARARERAAASDRAAEGFRDEMRRSVGAERQRVAGMLYKEALQTQTVEDLQRQVRACLLGHVQHIVSSIQRIHPLLLFVRCLYECRSRRSTSRWPTRARA